MSDWYQQLTNTPLGRQLTGVLGLPAPVELRRHDPDGPLIDGPVLVASAPGGRVETPLRDLLGDLGVDVRPDQAARDEHERFAALIYDATGVTASDALTPMFEFCHGAVRSLAKNGRLIIIGGVAADAADARQAAVAQALEGFTRSAAKEMRAGATANLLRVATGAEDAIGSSVRFLLSGRSAFVAGQVIEVHAPAGAVVEPDDLARPLAGKVALVTGAARGIGESIARTLARDGAHVICLDIPPQGDTLSAVANEIGGASLQLDITDADAPNQIATYVKERHGTIDIVVHNAGITRDKTLAGMDEARWNQVMSVNLTSQELINDALLSAGLVSDGGRIVCVSSMSGIAGNRGQTNYAASKAGIIGMVAALAPRVAEVPATINAVAPGFIETEMTDAMPLAVREVGRRMNSLNQGGKPVDVAETIAWLADPGSAGVNGQTIRVCGQNLLGA